MQGTTDIQVEVKQAEMLKACKPKATFVLIDGMNHVLKEASIDRQKNIATYGNANLPLHKNLIEPIVKFITNKK